MRKCRPGVFAAALLCGSFLTSAGCASSGATGETAREGGEPTRRPKKKVGSPMPSIVVSALEGKRKIDLGALHGKVVLVDIWASWCAPCMEEMPLLDEMAKRLNKKGKSVEIIAVSVDEDKASAQTFLSSRASWSLTVAHDPAGKVPEVLKPSKMPTSYIVDAQGIIRYVNEGFERDDLKTLESRLTSLAADAS
jgi:thiol-disulfide isomerase/thioredoxin